MQKLREILAQELELIEKLKAQEEEMQGYLIEGKARQLEKINAAREKMVGRLEQLEKERRSLLQAGGGASLRELLEKEKGPEKEQLQLLGEQIKRCYAALRRLQKLNMHLLRHNLQFARQMKEMFLPHADPGGYYGPGKRAGESAAVSGLVDVNA